VEHQEVVWLWSGFFAVHVTVTEQAAAFTGAVSGLLRVTVQATDAFDGVTRAQTLDLPISVAIIPTPARSKRLLWDQFHSIAYPSGYFPRNNLKVQGDMLDWCGNHLHTNFKDAYEHLLKKGFFVDVLTTDWTCVDAALYGAVLIVDSEDEFFPDEVTGLGGCVCGVWGGDCEGGSSQPQIILVPSYCEEHVTRQIRYLGTFGSLPCFSCVPGTDGCPPPPVLCIRWRRWSVTCGPRASVWWCSLIGSARRG